MRLQPYTQNFRKFTTPNTDFRSRVALTASDKASVEPSNYSMDLVFGGHSYSQPQNDSDPALLPNSVMIEEPQFLSAPLTNFPNDDLNPGFNVFMGDSSRSTNFQSRKDFNTLTQRQFPFDTIMQMHVPPEAGHLMLDDPKLFNCDLPYNPPMMHPESDTAFHHRLDTQNLTETEHVALKHQSSIRKRAPKAPNMINKWGPAEFRLRKLYVTQGKQIKDVQTIINKEFAINATEIQYKQEIERLKIQRRAEARERESIVLHTLYRKKALKKRSYVRLRGHEIAQKKLMRWIKETKNLPELTASPPSLSSGISVRSVSYPGSPRLTSGFTNNHSMSKDDAFANIISAVLSFNTRASESVINSREAGSVFNELQKLLSSKPDTDLMCIEKDPELQPYECKYTQSSPSVAQDILELRNRINIDQRLVFQETHNCNNISLPKFLDQQSQLSISKFNDRTVSWKTNKGVRIDASFYSELAIPMLDSNEEISAEEVEVRTTTTVVIVSNATKKPSYRVAFSFCLSLPITVTFAATIPNTSEVFQIVSEGDLGLLRKALQLRTANLTDRDEEGRSLLNYAITAVQPEMINFLLDNEADPNAIEMSDGGFIGPVHILFWGIDSEIDDKENAILVRKYRSATLLASHGADFSIKIYHGSGIWHSSGTDLVMTAALAQFQSMIDYGAPFVYPNSLSSWGSLDLSFLSILAINSGHYLSNIHEVVDKAIFLLRRGADVNYRRPNTGDTLLHTILKNKRLPAHKDHVFYTLGRVLLSVQAPLELLVAFIAAGANVFAHNDNGWSPMETAWKYGREKEWHRALTVCGIDLEAFYDSTCRKCHQSVPEPPSSKLTFEAFCDRRKSGTLFNDLVVDEDERRWLHGDCINVPFKVEWAGREYHNPHGSCFEKHYGSPYLSDEDYSEDDDIYDRYSEGAENNT